MITTESNLCTPSILFEPDVKHDVIYQYYMNRMLSMIYLCNLSILYESDVKHDNYRIKPVYSINIIWTGC